MEKLTQPTLQTLILQLQNLIHSSTVMIVNSFLLSVSIGGEGTGAGAGGGVVGSEVLQHVQRGAVLVYS